VRTGFTHSKLATRSDLIHGKVPDSSARGSTVGNGLLKRSAEQASVTVWNSPSGHPDCSQATQLAAGPEIESSRLPAARALPRAAGGISVAQVGFGPSAECEPARGTFRCA
jgi:hypothetical protein